VSDTGTLRDQQAEFTRQILMEAAKRVIESNSVDDFTIQKVAEEAGMSHRTVYRYFPSRQELLDAFTDWMEDSVTPADYTVLAETEDIPIAVQRAFDRFDRYAPYFRAGILLANRGEPIQPHRQKERDVLVRSVLSDVLVGLEPEQADEAYAIIRHLLGANTWQVLHDRFELRDGRSGRAVTWALEVLLDALREGRAPGSNAEGDGN
jgi:AcrR family transcriptional regulator